MSDSQLSATPLMLFMALNKPIARFSENDLRSLIASGAGDPQAMELKAEMPRPTEAGKLGFLADVASFANARGGYLLYGAALRKGASAELTGLPADALNDAMHWLEPLAAIGIAPRTPGLRMKVVPLQNHSAVLVIRIPQSWAGPHMVAFRHANKFFSRNADGKHLLDVDELRSAFSLSESAREKLRAFRLDRVNTIMNRELTINLSEAPKTVLHILPVSSLAPGFRIDLEQLAQDDSRPVPMGARGLVSHFNFDGLISFSSVEKFAYSYVQAFRNGCLEATESLLLEPRDGRKFFPSVAFEREIIQCGARLLDVLHRLEIDPPYVVMLSFLGVRGYSMFVSSMRWQTNANQIERDDLYLDEIIIEDAKQDFAQVMRPVFDQVWNACGWAKSLNYDADGNWREPST